jgi:hypothetical protein
MGSVGIALAMTWLAIGGCSFSDSSKSISDSISGSSKSFSDSSTSSSPSDDASSGKAETSYRDDVRGFTAAYVRDGGDFTSFQRGLAAIARRHGISDWEASATTWTGVGAGLRSAGASADQRAALTDELAGDDAAKRRDIERGYAG